MNLKALLAPQVSIRLTEDMTGFVCTVQHGLFNTELALYPNPSPLTELLDDGVQTKRCDPVVVLRARHVDPRS
jgi:hypothetical protein